MRFLKAISFGLILSAMTQAFAQTETFDMMTYTPPKGWERKEFEDRVALLKTDQSCAIMIYGSRESSGSAKTDFEDEWKERVAKQFNTTAEPTMQSPLAAEGGEGELLMGGAKVESIGAKISALLVVYRGYGRAMSVLNLLSGDCGEDIKGFLLKLEFSKTRRPR